MDSDDHHDTVGAQRERRPSGALRCTPPSLYQPAPRAPADLDRRERGRGFAADASTCSGAA